ncbi:phage tail fiber protein [Enterobacter cloacae]|nr:hypothetical protein [Enterobacter cloacae]
MHRIDTPTAQADKFGPGKNGFTNGDPATGRRATDLNSDMWDAVQEEICAVIEESGLALNKDQHDQLYQAIVKIIISKIPDALLKKNNLSDLTDKVLARANLQLKTAAQKDVVTSKTDVTAERVLTTGWMSLGGYGTDNMIAGSDAKKSLRNGFYGVQSEPTYGNAAVISFGYDSGSQVHIIAGQGGQAPFLGVCGSTPQGAFGNWGKIYTEFQKPTAGDVGALPIGGGTITGNVAVNGSVRVGKERMMEVSSSNTSSLNGLINLWGAADRPTVIEFKDSNGYHFYSQRNTDGSVSFNFNGEANFGGGITSSSEIISRYANGFRIAYGSYGTFWRNDGTRLYLMLTNSGDPLGNYNNLRPFVVDLTNGNITINNLSLVNYASFDARYYTKTDSDARFQPKGNYTPAGQAYTKGESDARYQLKNTASRAANGWFKDTTTGMIYQWGRNASSVVGNTTVTFPIAFPNACLNVQNTLIRNSGSAGERPWGFVTSFNNTSVNLSSDATGSYWYAIGY